MLQRWLKTWAVLTVSGMLFSACQKQNYSKDEPLDPVYSPSLFISSQNQFFIFFGSKYRRQALGI